MTAFLQAACDYTDGPRGWWVPFALIALGAVFVFVLGAPRVRRFR